MRDRLDARAGIARPRVVLAGSEQLSLVLLTEGKLAGDHTATSVAVYVDFSDLWTDQLGALVVEFSVLLGHGRERRVLGHLELAATRVVLLRLLPLVVLVQHLRLGLLLPLLKVLRVQQQACACRADQTESVAIVEGPIQVELVFSVQHARYFLQRLASGSCAALLSVELLRRLAF